MFIEKKGYCKDSNEICLSTKKVIVKLFKRKDSSVTCLLKKKVILKLFKRKDSNELCLLKKGYCETF